MKRITLIVAMVLMGLGASARSIHYFTYSQAARTVSYLNSQQELMIYCGYDYEIETYVLVNEVWMERVNSAYYEIWLYGYDAYTGDEVYMPLDLQCVWLFSGRQVYNAAQYLRFRVEVKPYRRSWYVPAYNRYTRVVHPAGYRRSYHYDIHRYGWMPPAYTYGPSHPTPPLPHYYMRQPGAPAPSPAAPWTPGVERPTVTPTVPSSTQGIAGQTHDNNPTTGATLNPTGSGNTHNSSNVRTGGEGRSSSTTPSSSSVRKVENSGSSNVRNSGSTNVRNNNSNSGSSNGGSTNSGISNVRNSGSTNVRNSGSTNVRNSGSTNVRNSGSTNSGSTNSGSSNVRNSSSLRTSTPATVTPTTSKSKTLNSNEKKHNSSSLRTK